MLTPVKDLGEDPPELDQVDRRDQIVHLVERLNRVDVDDAEDRSTATGRIAYLEVSEGCFYYLISQFCVVDANQLDLNQDYLSKVESIALMKD